MKRITLSLVAIFFFSALLSTVGAQPGEESAGTQPRTQKTPAQAEQKAEKTPESSTKAGQALAAQMFKRGVVRTAALSLGVSPLKTPARSQESTGWHVAERLLMELPTGFEPEWKLFVHPTWHERGRSLWNAWASRDATHVAVLSKRDGWMTMFVDGKPTASGKEIGAALFSPDGLRYAFGVREEKWRVVLDGRAQPEFDDIGQMAFSPDSRHFAYTARRGRAWRIVVDGQEGPEFDGVALPIFSPTDQHLVYFTRSNKEWEILPAGADASKWDEVTFPVFSADGKHFGYAGRRGRDWHMVVDGVPGRPFSELSPIVFGAGKHFAYRAVLPKELNIWHLITDGEVSALGLLSSPTFSGDGAHLVYAALTEMQVDGHPAGKLRPFPEYEKGGPFPTELVANLDATRIAVLVAFPRTFRSGPRYASTMLQLRTDPATGHLVIADEKHGSVHDFFPPWNLKISPDGRHYAYEAHHPGVLGGFVVVDGKVGPTYEQILPSSMSLSTDSVIYVVRKGRGFFRAEHRY